jgi:hypothetical protein
MVIRANSLTVLVGDNLHVCVLRLLAVAAGNVIIHSPSL